MFLRKRSFRIFALTALLLAAVLYLYLSQILTTVAHFVLPKLGVEISELIGLNLTTQAASFEKAVVTMKRPQLDAEAVIKDTQVTFDISKFQEGKLDNVIISELDLRIGANKSEQSEYSSLKLELPVNSAEISRLHLKYTNKSFDDFSDLNFVGQLKYQAGVIKCSGILKVDKVPISANLSISFDVLNSNGNAVFSTNEISLSEASVVPTLRKFLPKEIDLLSGKIKVEGELKIEKEKLSQSSQVRLILNSGNLKSSLFAVKDINGEAIFLPGRDFESKKFNLTAESLDVGIDMRTLRFDLKFSRESLRIASGSAEALGGRISVKDALVFYDPKKESLLNIHAEQLKLKEILSLYPSEKISGEGQIDVQFPLVIKDNAASIKDGKIVSLEGGSLKVHYAKEDVPESVQFVYQALRDLVYKKLTGTFNLDKSGNLLIKLAIEGVNPKLNINQPINVNLSVEENVISLLKSLSVANDLTKEVQDNID